MNIIVVPFCSDGYYCRPDTTLEKEPKDYYIPDSITDLTLAPVVFVKITKSGKAVSEKFSERYYDSFSSGVLIYGENLINADDCTSFSQASSLDSSSYLPFAFKPLSDLKDFNCKLVINGKEAVDMSVDDSIIPFVNEFISIISSRTSLRIGDIIAFETIDRLPVKKDDSIAVVSSLFNFGFRIR